MNKYQSELDQAAPLIPVSKKILKRMSKSDRRVLDEFFHREHEQAFRRIDCLECANCCKTTSPIFRDIDIKRISKRLKMPERKFVESYLYQDDERDYVLKKAPCPFLHEDNTCNIYEDRPLACREYPHTDRKAVYQINDLTLKNALICPAVTQILTRLNAAYEKSS